MISFSGNNIVNIKYGDSQINSVYYGSQLIWILNSGKKCTLHYISDNKAYCTVLNAVRTGDIIDLSKLDGTYAGHDKVNVFPQTKDLRQFNDYLYYSCPFITRATTKVDTTNIVTSFSDNEDHVTKYPQSISCVYLSSIYDEEKIRNLYTRISLFDDSDIVDSIVNAVTSTNSYFKTLHCNRSKDEYYVDNNYYRVPNEADTYTLLDVLANFNQPVYNDLSIYLYSFYPTEMPFFIPTCTSVGNISINDMLKNNEISGIFENLTPLYEKDDTDKPQLTDYIETNGMYYPYMRLSVDTKSADADYKNYVSSFFIGLHGIDVMTDDSIKDIGFSIDDPDEFYDWCSLKNNRQMKYLYYEYEERKDAVDNGLVEYPFVRMWYWSVLP